MPKSSEMITYILNLNSHWQLGYCCSWRGWADLHIYCQRRGRREFYWPGRIMRIREVKQVCSDLLEYSVGSKGTGSELESIVSLNASCVPLCSLLWHLPGHLYLWGWQEGRFQLLSAYPWFWEEIAANPLGAPAWKKEQQLIAISSIPEIPSTCFQSLGTAGHSLGGRFTVFAFKKEPSQTTPGNVQGTILLSLHPSPSPAKCLSKVPLLGHLFPVISRPSNAWDFLFIFSLVFHAQADRDLLWGHYKFIECPGNWLQAAFPMPAAASVCMLYVHFSFQRYC